jgi:hypothetical protein
MVSDLCDWCEYLSISADLIGFIGAGLLAYPFLRGQRARDEAGIINPTRVPDVEDAAVFAQAKARMTSDILNRMHREYRVAWLGAALISVAFMGKFASALPDLF